MSEDLREAVKNCNAVLALKQQNPKPSMDPVHRRTVELSKDQLNTIAESLTMSIDEMDLPEGSKLLAKFKKLLPIIEGHLK